jgi:hypothetical protein
VQEALVEQKAKYLGADTPRGVDVNGVKRLTSQEMQQSLQIMQRARRGMDLQGPGAKYQSLAEDMKSLMGELEKQLSFSTAAETGLVDHIVSGIAQKRQALDMHTSWQVHIFLDANCRATAKSRPVQDWTNK